MPSTSAPLDVAYTNFHLGDTPGAGDFDRLQNNQKYLTSMPSARVGRSDSQTYPTQSNTSVFTTLFWNVLVNKTDPNMVNAIGGGTYDDHLKFLYPGSFAIGLALQLQFANATNQCTVKLIKGFTISGSDVLLDQVTVGARLGTVSARIYSEMHIITAAEITNGAILKAQITQNSGADMQSVANSPEPAFPMLWLAQRGTGNV